MQNKIFFVLSIYILCNKMSIFINNKLKNFNQILDKYLIDKKNK